MIQRLAFALLRPEIVMPIAKNHVFPLVATNVVYVRKENAKSSTNELEMLSFLDKGFRMTKTGVVARVSTWSISVVILPIV
jgi:hypothetical protein